MYPADPLLKPTRLLDFDHPSIARLITNRGWKELAQHEQIGAVYGFVRNEIAFGYNHADDIPASRVLTDGYGQCNTKGTLLMALLRGVGVRCRLHGFTIHKALQRGVVPEIVYPIAPDEILHSWVEAETEEGWVNLEGFILDEAFLGTLQAAFSGTESPMRLWCRNQLFERATSRLDRWRHLHSENWYCPGFWNFRHTGRILPGPPAGVRNFA